jgi:hypothetical protein
MNDYILDAIEEKVSQYGTRWSRIADELDENPEKLRSIWRRRSRLTQKGEESTPIFIDKKEMEQVDWRKLAAHAKAGSSLDDSLDYTQESATVKIDTDTPIAVVYTGDWHLGDTHTNHEDWLSDMKTIMDTPAVYMVDLGDSYQNMRSFKVLSAVLEQVLSPAQQAALFKSLVDELTEKGKLLAKVGGNHDQEFDERTFGESLQRYLLDSIEAPIFSNRGLLRLQIGKQTYTNLLFHKSRFRSVFRPTHGAYREWQMSYPAEVVVGAHDHVPAAEIMYGYTWAQELGEPIGGQTFLLKVGTYQASSFGYRYFHNSMSLNPAIVYYPDQHKKVLFTSAEDAIQYIRRN